MSRLTQVVYLSRGSRFIAIQERVDILTGDGVEMTPFHNISKEVVCGADLQENPCGMAVQS